MSLTFKDKVCFSNFIAKVSQYDRSAVRVLPYS